MFSSVPAGCLLYARFTSERGSWVDLGIGSGGLRQVCYRCAGSTVLYRLLARDGGSVVIS
jgi:hypothetical protein